MFKRVTWGLILILLGVVMLFDQLNIMDFGDLISIYWPIILIVLGLAGLFSRNSSKVGNLILIALGVFFQLKRLGYITVSLWQVFWPTILIIVGLNIIFQRDGKSHKVEINIGSGKENIVEEDTVDYFRIFTGEENINLSKNFQGGRMTAIFAGIQLDLRDSEIKDGLALLNLTAILGGIEILVPSHWNVEVNATPILGGIEKSVQKTMDENAPTLKINGTAILGGIEIK